MLPITLTIWIVYTVIKIISIPLDFFIGEKAPLFVSFIATIFILTLIGLLAKNILGRYVLRFLEYFFHKTPFISTIYGSVKQIVSAFSLSDKKNMQPVMVEYPRKGLNAIGFLTNNNISNLTDINGKDVGKNKVAVLIPTTPNPTSGFFVYVDKKEISYLNISVDECIKILMSAGVVNI